MRNSPNTKLILLVLSIYIILSAIPALAKEPYGVLWLRDISYVIGHGITLDNDGNVYVVGQTRVSLDGNSYHGIYDACIIKYAPDGSKIWSRQFGTSNFDTAHGVAVDSVGNVYVTGTASGELAGNGHMGDRDIFLVKFDASGNKIWTRQAGTPAEETAWDIAVDSSDDIILTGETFGALDGNTNMGGKDYFLMKFDSEGNKKWTKQFGTEIVDYAKGLAVDEAGNIYTAVTTSWIETIAPDSWMPQGNGEISKYDPDGNLIWTQKLATDLADIINDIAVDPAGFIYVTGETYGVFDNNKYMGGEDIFVAKFSSDGSKLWIKQTGTADTDGANAIAVDSNHNVYITGETEGNLLDGSFGSAYTDIILIKFDADGNTLWKRQIDRGLDITDDIAVDPYGNAYITGYGVFVMKLGEITLGTAAGEDSEVSSDMSDALEFTPVGDKKEYVPRTLIFSRWGDAPHEFGMSNIGDLDRIDLRIIGARTFTFDNEGNIYIYDPVQSHLKKFTQDGNYVESIGPILLGEAFAIDDRKHIFALKEYRVDEYSYSGELIKHHELSKDIGTSNSTIKRGIGIDSSGNLYLSYFQRCYLISEWKNGIFETLPKRTQKVSDRKGIPGYQRDIWIFVYRDGETSTSLQMVNNAGYALKKMPLLNPEEMEIFVAALKQDKHGFIYIDNERVSSQNKHLEIRKYDENGNYISKIELPINYYKPTYKKVEVDDYGNIYQLLTTPKGVQFIKWELQP